MDPSETIERDNGSKPGARWEPEAVALAERVGRFVDASQCPGPVDGVASVGVSGQRAAGDARAPEPESFESLANAIARLQLAAYPALRRLAASRGIDPAVETVSWRRLPPVPVRAFRTLRFHLAPPREVFRSSGTTGGVAERSVHYHPFPALYRRVIDAAFVPACLPSGDPDSRRPLLSLVGSRAQMPDSSLAFMIDHLLERHGTPESMVAFGPEGLDVAAADAFCAAREADGRPATVFATAFALADWLDALTASDRRFRLAPGSTVFETGGYKGRRRALDAATVAAGVAERLGVPPRSLVREYGMTELTSHAYTRALAGGDPGLFVPPPSLAVRVLDPVRLEEVPRGDVGLVSFFDLANVGSVASIVSQDLGREELLPRDDRLPRRWRSTTGIRLLGRAEGAALRGCSLAVEELGTGDEVAL